MRDAKIGAEELINISSYQTLPAEKIGKVFKLAQNEALEKAGARMSQ